MQHDAYSFWSEIKNLDAHLKENPDSFCFARLADVYLKVGLVDDALHQARQGVVRYPYYLAGQKALAMVCHAKGLLNECQHALEQVTSCQPEDSDAQKMLAQIYIHSGDLLAAKKCYQILLDFFPEDNDSIIKLKSLQASPSLYNLSDSTLEEEEFIEELDEDDILEIDEMDLIKDDETEENTLEKNQLQQHEYEPKTSIPVTFIDSIQTIEKTQLAPAKQEHQDPLSTATLAELYVKQGFLDKALIIYYALLADNPNNKEVQARIQKLEPNVDKVNKPEKFELSDSSQTITATLPSIGNADNRVATLSTWLENIRRIKLCR